MGGVITKAESSNTVGTACSHAELGMLFKETCKLAPEFSTAPSDIDSVFLTITPVFDINPVYSNCPKTLALVICYFWYKIYAPLFYLAFVKHCVDVDGDDKKYSMIMLAPALVEGSPSKDISAAELPEEIRKGQRLLVKGLSERKNELEEELRYLKKSKRYWSVTSSVLCLALVVINLMALVAATLAMSSIMAAAVVSVVVTNLLVVFMKMVDPWFGLTVDERKSQLESQANAIMTMREGTNYELLRPHFVDKIRRLVEDLKKERAELHATDDHADQGGVGHTAAAAAHLEREAEERKKKGIENVREIVDRLECKVKDKAFRFVNVIAK